MPLVSWLQTWRRELLVTSYVTLLHYMIRHLWRYLWRHHTSKLEFLGGNFCHENVEWTEIILFTVKKFLVPLNKCNLRGFTPFSAYLAVSGYFHAGNFVGSENYNLVEDEDNLLKILLAQWLIFIWKARHQVKILSRIAQCSGLDLCLNSLSWSWLR